MLTASVQVSPCPGSDISTTHKPAAYYATRRDVVGIKQKILSGVPDSKEYWRVLSLYIYGMCTRSQFDTMVREQLISDELCFLHNELLRAILFNAHFSRIPPPNVRFESTTPVTNIPKPLHVVGGPQKKNLHFSTFTAAELQRLPTSKDLAKRENVPRLRDENTCRALASAIHLYVVRLLERCHRAHVGRGRLRVTVGQVLEAARFNVSPDLLAKYSSC